MNLVLALSAATCNLVERKWVTGRTKSSKWSPCFPTTSIDFCATAACALDDPYGGGGGWCGMAYYATTKSSIGRYSNPPTLPSLERLSAGQKRKTFNSLSVLGASCYRDEVGWTTPPFQSHKKKRFDKNFSSLCTVYVQLVAAIE